MFLLSTLCISLSLLTPIKEIPISDKAVINSLNVYLDSLGRKNQNYNEGFFIMARVTKESSDSVIYLSSGVYLILFKSLPRPGDYRSIPFADLPTAYSRFKGHIVFWYMGNENSNDSKKAFFAFKQQFKNDVIDDLNRDGSFNYDFYSTNNFHPLLYRFIKKDGATKPPMAACQFPNNTFFFEGHQFDKNGDLMFSDGAYDECSLDRPFKYWTEHPSNYLEARGFLEIQESFPANLTIDSTGRVVDVAFINLKNYVRPGQKSKVKSFSAKEKAAYKNAILSMTCWAVGTVRGKKVSWKYQF